jgi:hypothetical protein
MSWYIGLNLIPRYSVCEEYVYLADWQHPVISYCTTEDVKIEWPFRQRAICHFASLYGSTVRVSSEESALHLLVEPHAAAGSSLSKETILTRVPKSLRTAKTILLTGDEENPLLRVLFLPKVGPPQMRYLRDRFLKRLASFGLIRYAEGSEAGASSYDSQGHGGVVHSFSQCDLAKVGAWEEELGPKNFRFYSPDSVHA